MKYKENIILKNGQDCMIRNVLYYQRALYPTCFLFVCYGVLAIVGWINWKKKGKWYDQKI